MQTMALSWTLLLVTVVLSLGAEPGAAQRRQAQTSAGGSNALQHPLRGHQVHGHNKDREGHRSQGAQRGAGLLSQRSPYPMSWPEDDGTGLEGLGPVRLEMGPGWGRDTTHLSVKNPSQERENHLSGTRKGKGHGHRNGHTEHRRQGGRRNKGRHGKGLFLTGPVNAPFTRAQEEEQST